MNIDSCVQLQPTWYIEPRLQYQQKNFFALKEATLVAGEETWSWVSWHKSLLTFAVASITLPDLSIVLGGKVSMMQPSGTLDKVIGASFLPLSRWLCGLLSALLCTKNECDSVFLYHYSTLFKEREMWVKEGEIFQWTGTAGLRRNPVLPVLLIGSIIWTVLNFLTRSEYEFEDGTSRRSRVRQISKGWCGSQVDLRASKGAACARGALY